MPYVTDWTSLQTESAFGLWGADVRAPAIVTYSFYETANLPDPDDLAYPSARTRALHDYERETFYEAVAQFEEAAGLIFVEVPEGGNINVVAVEGSGLGGWAGFPGNTPSVDLALEEMHLLVMLHELGHTVGLKHPFDDGFTGGVVLQPALDIATNTIMSYTGIAQRLGYLDIQALVDQYGTPFDISQWQITVEQGGMTVVADSANNVLTGNELYRNTLYGLGGDDWLLGEVSADLLGGGAGNDLIESGAGADSLYGAAGNDTLRAGDDDDLLGGGDGQDWLDGGAGSDRLFGALGNDNLVGRAGDDTLGGAAGHDTLSGGNGDDQIWGAHGNDSLYGSTGEDTLGGGAGDDLLYGGGDADRLYSGAGQDTVDAGAGDDLIYLGSGADVLVFSTGHDRVEDFDAAEDRIDLSDVTWANGFATLSQTDLTNVPGGVLIGDGRGDTLFLAGVDGAELSADTFLF